MKRWKYLILTLLAVSACFCVYGGTLLHYISQYYGYELDYPDTWQTGAEGGNVYFLMPRGGDTPGQYDFVLVSVEEMKDKDIAIEDYSLVFFRDAPKKIPDFVPLEKGRVNLDGQQCLYAVYTSSHLDRPMRNKVYYFINGGKLYSITYSAGEDTYEKHFSEADSIIRSIRVQQKEPVLISRPLHVDGSIA